jgi:integrase
MGMYKRGGVWWCSLVSDGVRTRRSLNTGNRAEAVKAHASLLLGQDPREPSVLSNHSSERSILFDDFVNEYLEWAKVHKKSHEFDAYRMRTLLRYFGGKMMARITTADVERFIIERKKDLSNFTGVPISNTGVNRDVLCLQTMFRVAVNFGHVKDNPVRRVQKLKENPRRLEYLKKEEIQAFLEACTGQFKVIAVVAVYCGLRKGEILNLRWQDIDYERKLIEIVQSKTNKKRFVPMPPRVILALREHPVLEGCEFVFHKSKGERLRHFTGSLRGALERAGLRRIRFHDLRHTYASQMMMAGASPLLLMENLGHASLEMTERYSHLTEEYKQEMAEKFEASLSQFSHNLRRFRII